MIDPKDSQEINPRLYATVTAQIIIGPQKDTVYAPDAYLDYSNIADALLRVGLKVYFPDKTSNTFVVEIPSDFWEKHGPWPKR